MRRDNAHLVAMALLASIDQIEIGERVFTQQDILDGIRNFTASVLVESDASISIYVRGLRSVHAEALAWQAGKVITVGEA